MLQELNQIYGKTLGGLRVIIIHAGLSFQCPFVAVRHLDKLHKNLYLPLLFIHYMLVPDIYLIIG